MLWENLNLNLALNHNLRGIKIKITIKIKTKSDNPFSHESGCLQSFGTVVTLQDRRPGWVARTSRLALLEEWTYPAPPESLVSGHRSLG